VPRSLSALARLASILAVLAAGAGRVAAHGTDNVVMGSTADGGGSLFAGYDYAHPVLVTASATIAGFTVHTASAPGLTPLLADDAGASEYVLDDGTIVTLTLAAPLDAGVSVKIGSTVLDAVGESAVVGTFSAATADQFHVHPTWTLTVPSGTTTTRQASFTLAAAGYADSPVHTLVLSNAAPRPTASGGGGTPTPSPAATPGAAHLDDADARPAVKCATALRSAAGAHVRAAFAGGAKCAATVLRCIQRDPDDAACLTRATKVCAKTGAKIDSGVEKLAAVVAKNCARVGLAGARAAAGLGFETAAAPCSDLGEPLDDLTGIGRCVARAHTCGAAALLDVAVPRAGEALRFVGQSVLPAACLPDRGGTGLGLGAPKGDGTRLLACQAAVSSGMAKILQARLARTSRCVGALFACVQQRPSDEACLDRARRACAAGDAKVAAAETKLTTRVAMRCGPVAFDVLAGADGAGLAALAGTCAAHGVAALASLDDYRECLRRAAACGAGALAAVASPRAAELSAFGGVALADAFCPEAP
jgi:hypothetical protein